MGATVLAACGGGADAGGEVATLSGESAANADDAAATGDEVDSSQALLDFAACMRENGVEMDDPTFDAEGNVQGFGPGGSGGVGAGQGFDPRSDDFQTAIEACNDLIAGADFGGPGGGRGFDRTGIQDAFNEFTACLRDEGVQVDDLTLGGAGGGPGAPDGDGGPPADGDGGGFAGGPPPDGAATDGGPGGGAGFDPTDRIIEQLDLDEEDPAVTAAVETCQPVLQDAFNPPADGADA